MLKVEYRHDIQKNYLVVQGREEGNYMLHMLAGKDVQGFLPLEIREMNNEKEYYYDITGRETLTQKSNREKWKGFLLKNCISQILTEIGKCKEYLLNPDNLVLDPAYIYIDIQNNEVALCYVHDYNMKINEQLTQLFSYFMNVMDYQNKDAVQMVYKLYEISREAHCTLNDLQKIVALGIKKPVIKKIDPEGIEKESVPQIHKNRKSLISNGNKRKIDSNIEGNLKKRSNRKDKSISEKKIKEDVKKSKIRNKSNIKENIILTAILQIALLLLLAVAAKAGVFCDELGISVTKSVMGLLVLGALDMFILGRVFAAEEEGGEEIVLENQISNQFKEEGIREKEISAFQNKKVVEQEYPLIKNKEIELIEHPVSFIEKQKEIVLPLEDNNTVDKTVVLDHDKTIIQAIGEEGRKNQCYLVPEEQGQEIISLGAFPFFIGRFQKDTNSLKKKKNISRMHSKIEQMGEQFFITDLNSTNGTFINEKRIEGNQRIALVEGDKISFADIPYYFTREWKAS